jgi:uncharacterized DUF497 family protein
MYVFLCAYFKLMRIVWDEIKRPLNLRKHGLDFADARVVFDGVTYTREDTRFEYDEQRFITIGLLGSTVAVIAHAETRKEIRIISMRKATRREKAIYFESDS